MNLRTVLALSLLAPAFLAPEANALIAYRYAHTSTLLPDGNILVTGGAISPSSRTANVEMYNMATNLYQDWTDILGNARSSHTATLMSDGRVLIAGGFIGGGTPTSDLEICNPATRACTDATVNMITPRGGHTATLLSKGTYAGQVLLCGGQSAASSSTITGNCEVFNPAGPGVTAVAAMVSPRMGHAATLVRSGRVFVTGGVRAGGNGSAQWLYEPMNEMYDPSANTWTPVSSLLQGRTDHTATVLNNGKIMIAGGYNAFNALYCMEDENSLLEDCWHIKYFDTQHNTGTHGYIDGAEFYDQNGARVVLAEAEQGAMPYRVARHTAILNTSGRWELQGGYGNIFPTFFANTPALTDNSLIRLDTIAGSSDTARVRTNSVIEFPLDFQLSRPVNGRLVDADLFFSKPSSVETPSIQIENVQFDLPRSTAIVDGAAVGLLLGPDTDFAPGDFQSTVRLNLPTGMAEFEPQTVDSGRTPNTTNSVNSALQLGADAFPSETVPITGGTLRVAVAFFLPDVYRGRVMGSAEIMTGGLIDGNEEYDINLDGGMATFNLAAGACDDDDNQCLFTGTLDFTNVTGSFSNLTMLDANNGTTFYMTAPPPPAYPTAPAGPVNVGIDQANLSLELTYTANEVHILDKEPTYNFDRSTAVIRGMIFNTRLNYVPATNAWTSLSDDKDEDTLALPSFNHTTLLTPAGDTVVMGGANCEFNPPSDCRRAPNVRFSTATAESVIIPVYAGSGGETNWTLGPKLGSKRASHTSTLLPTGHILTCGGTDGVRPLATCEIMNPVTKTWTATGSMNYARSGHTATLLPNGNVLIAGGKTPDGVATATAEVFYPLTQRWIATSSMTLARQLHTATLLPDGNVLVAGGAATSAYSPTSEIYISSTSYWINGGTMVNGRSQHTATLLKNGNVMIAGGVDAFGAVRQTEIYNYLSRTFAAAGNLVTARYDHTAIQLRDGNVLVIGGSNANDSLRTSEIYSAGAWSLAGALLNYNRANHRTVLLPNGKVMLTGGEVRGVVNTIPESFDPDFHSWTKQGETVGRTHHTSLLTKDNLIISIGGWGQGQYLDSTEAIDFNYNPDMNGLEAETTRQAMISTGTVFFNQGWRATLISDTSNFHGITEASGGGAGPMNASFHNPRVYMQQMDNPSGFLIDLSTRIYTVYDAASPNTQWERTLSSITIITPNLPGVMPHGWYHMRVAAAGVFSEAFIVQVTTPRPSGLASEPTGAILGTSSVTWSWDRGTIPPNGADGYSIYSATDNVFITTVAFGNTGTYTQTGLVPNTAASIAISAYNLGGYGPLSKSATYYTLAATPTPLNITAASFETATLEWARNDNSEITTYEVSMAPAHTPQFGNPVAISTPVPFSVNYMSTSTVITSLSANQMYNFRVRARNGAGLETAFSSIASTITVSGVNNFSGQALSSSTINWSWDESVGATYYELYDVTAGSAAAVFIGSTTTNSFNQTALSANNEYFAVVQAVSDTGGFGPISGPQSAPYGVFTLTVQPLPGVPNVFTNVSTGSLTANWITNGNSTWTVYSVSLATGIIISTQTTNEASRNFTGLTPNVAYTVTITPVNGDGIAGTAMELGTKYTLARVPSSLTPVDISMSGIELAWDTAGNSEETIYELRSSTSDVFAEPVVTHVPFSYGYTEAGVFINGLLTATSYYFDVAARNGEGIVTARKRALAAFTVPGPSGAPSGSIGGTSDPSDTAVIAGTLPNNRAISLSVPPGAFASATSIAISSSATNVCGYLAGNTTPVEVAIFTEGGVQPQEPVTLTLNFNQDPTAAKNDIINKASQVVMARYNPVSGQCLPLETKVNIGDRTITATLNHFSIFQLMVRTAASDLANVLIYPNPFYANRGQGFITIDRLPANAKVRVYTLSGDKVWETTSGSTGMVIWRGTNKSGNLVASGIYLAVIDSSAGKKVFKIAVER